MRLNNQTQERANNYGSVMEAENHLKNGSKPKVFTSRRSILNPFLRAGWIVGLFLAINIFVELIFVTNLIKSE